MGLSSKLCKEILCRPGQPLRKFNKVFRKPDITKIKIIEQIEKLSDEKFQRIFGVKRQTFFSCWIN